VVNTIKENGGTAVANYDSVATEDGAKRIIQTAVDYLADWTFWSTMPESPKQPTSMKYRRRIGTPSSRPIFTALFIAHGGHLDHERAAIRKNHQYHLRTTVWDK
jgi:hypothetical protein